jgi:hypothetical protein
MWLSNTGMFIGDLYCGYMNEGKLYELQPDNTYTLYQVNYDHIKDAKEGKRVDD